MNSVCFVSGHRNITQDEFDEHYIPLINDAVDDGCSFVLGDFEGVDLLSQQLLSSIDAKFTVYHMGDTPQHIVGDVETSKDYN